MVYKGFDLSCFFQGLTNESFWIDPAATAPFIAYYYGGEDQGAFVPQNALLKAYADNHWSEHDPNVAAMWPRLSDVANANNTTRRSEERRVGKEWVGTGGSAWTPDP